MLDFQVAQFLQQFCGINAVFSYAVIIFKVMRMKVVMKMGTGEVSGIYQVSRG